MSKDKDKDKDTSSIKKRLSKASAKNYEEFYKGLGKEELALKAKQMNHLERLRRGLDVISVSLNAREESLTEAISDVRKFKQKGLEELLKNMRKVYDKKVLDIIFYKGLFFRLGLLAKRPFLSSVRSKTKAYIRARINFAFGNIRDHISAQDRTLYNVRESRLVDILNAKFEYARKEIKYNTILEKYNLRFPKSPFPKPISEEDLSNISYAERARQLAVNVKLAIDSFGLEEVCVCIDKDNANKFSVKRRGTKENLILNYPAMYNIPGGDIDYKKFNLRLVPWSHVAYFLVTEHQIKLN